MDNLKISWAIIKFHGQFRNFMDNSEISWTIPKFHGQFENFMDNLKIYAHFTFKKLKNIIY
jgi:hypothetical protein